MELTKDIWKKEDIKEFQDYLKTFENREKKDWTTNILRTNLPVLSMTTPVMKDIIKIISKGNFLSFLDLMIWEYYENTAINGFLINKIKDFNIKKKYLDIYSNKCDNWATCDLLKYNIKGYEKEYLDLTKEYIKNDKPFVRRIGLSILFNYINDDYINIVFNILDMFKNEEHYYVNMMNAWLLCECMIKQRDKTLDYLNHNNLNKFTINKGIQKCRDSYRVSKEDKELLLKYKIKQG